MAFLIPVRLLLFLQSQPSSPVIVKIIQPPKDPTGGLGDVLLGSLGLSGVITLLAVLCGAAVAAILFWIRSRSE
jgi:hypothetical protein